MLVNKLSHVNNVEGLLLYDELACCRVRVDEPAASVAARNNCGWGEEHLHTVLARDFSHVSNCQVSGNEHLALLLLYHLHPSLILYNLNKASGEELFNEGSDGF